MKNFKILYVFLHVSLVIAGMPGFAQTPVKSPYQRLLETQKDYLAAKSKGDTLEIAEMCYRMGKRYIGINNMVEAEKWLLRSARLRQPYQPHGELGKVYGMLAECEFYMGNPRKQFEFTVLAERHHRLDGSDISKMRAYRCAATLHEIGLRIPAPLYLKGFKASVDSSRKYYRASLELAKKLNFRVDQALAHQFIGNIEFNKGLIQAGTTEFERAIAVYRSENRAQNVIEARVQLANLLLNHRRFSLAKIQLDSARAAAESLNRAPTVGGFAMLDLQFSRYYQANQDWKSAFAHQQKYDSLTLLERDHYRETALTGINALHEYETKELKMALSQKELALARRTQANQRTLLWILLGITCAALTGGAIFHWLYRKHVALSEQHKALVREQSHRIKNNLQSVSDLMGLRLLSLTDPLAIGMMEESLSRVETIALIHKRLYTLEHLDTIELDAFVKELVEEVLNCREYGNIELDLNAGQVLLFVDHAIPLGLIIHEVVTNACKYAFPATEQPALQILICIINGDLQVDIADNGPGFQPQIPYRTFGMQIIHLLANKLKAQANFISTCKGSHFRIKFPLSERSHYTQSFRPKHTTDVIYQHPYH